MIQPRQYATSAVRIYLTIQIFVNMPAVALIYLTIHILLYAYIHISVRVPAVAHSSDSYLAIHIFVSDSIVLVDMVMGYGRQNCLLAVNPVA